MAADELQNNESSREDYAGQRDGVNEFGCPLIEGQNVSNAVQGLESLLAQLGFSSVEEMVAAAASL